MDELDRMPKKIQKRMVKAMKSLSVLILELQRMCLEMTDGQIVGELIEALELVFPKLRDLGLNADLSPPDFQALLKAHFAVMVGGLKYLEQHSDEMYLDGREINYENLWEFDLKCYPELNFLERISTIIDHLPSRHRYPDLFKDEVGALLQIPDLKEANHGSNLLHDGGSANAA